MEENLELVKPSLREQITAIANSFDLFECFESATAIRQFLIKQGISGKQIYLFTDSTQRPFCNIY